tara:strand:+ start:583 stop:933 length:351 start_codon:yes stop_codon:yes gene_type:complete
MNTIIEKPWGSYQIIEKGNNYLVKKITVYPNGKLSLQSHNYRSEHWIVVEGIAEIKINEKTFNLHRNESTYIPLKSKHRLSNNENNNLIIIEIWIGENLDENDITRYEDIYNRELN